jgi:hypothetical protein
MRVSTVLLASAAGVVLLSHAHAQGAGVCKPGAGGDVVRSLPLALVPQAAQVFDLHDMPAEQVRRSTVVRCMDGHLLACDRGANLPCGKANTSRSLKGGNAWCRRNPDSDFIPAYITGHDTIYEWRCKHGVPEPTATVVSVDARGFIAQYWKPLE